MYRILKRRVAPALASITSLLMVLVLLWTGVPGAAAQTKDKPNPPPGPTSLNPPVVVTGFPITISVLDNTQMDIEFTNPDLGQNRTSQFFGQYGDGVFMWVTIDGVTKVFGPAYTPGGHYTNAYIPVSNSLSGAGTPAEPWLVTTVNDVPGTKLRLTQVASYVNGAEYVKLQFTVQQLGGTEPVDVVLFHAADLATGGTDEIAYGYHNEATGGVGNYFTPTNLKMYQQFVPSVAPTAHQEGDYMDIWDHIGDIEAPGPGLTNVCRVDQPNDVGIGMQWALNVPTTETVTIGDTAFFGPHTMLAGSFNDVAYGTFSYEYVYYLATHNIVSGYQDGTYRPGNFATRGQIAKMVVLALGWEIDTTGGPHFTDVAPDSPFYSYIETAYNHHVIGGYPDGTFRYGANATRGQMMKMVVTAAGWEIDTTGGPHFTDVPRNSPFYDYIETAFNSRFISGYPDGTFRPGNNVTRAQLAKILYPVIAVETGK